MRNDQTGRDSIKLYFFLEPYLKRAHKIPEQRRPAVPFGDDRAADAPVNINIRVIPPEAHFSPWLYTLVHL